MKKTILALFFIIAGGIIPLTIFAQLIKQPNVAGQFYPADKEELALSVNKYLSEANPPEIRGKILGIIAPHAGYIYSGPVAAWSYKAVKGRKFDTVIILGPSHFYPFKGISVFKQGAFSVPLGRLDIDSDTASDILKLDFAGFEPKAFDREHSIEVELPFIIQALGKVNPVRKEFSNGVKIVPVVLGFIDYPQAEKLADVLIKISKKKKILVIASTDLSHYYPYETAVKIDKKTLKYIKALNPFDFWNKAKSREIEACGYTAVTVLLDYLSKQNAQIKILKYANSGDTSGFLNKVVGYVSAVGYIPESGQQKTDSRRPITEDRKQRTEGRGQRTENGRQKTESRKQMIEHKGGDMGLSIEDKKELINIARRTLQIYLTQGITPEFKASSNILKEKRGAFVTLRKNGRLRGCIGNIIGTKPLYLTVRDMAISAAVNDPRFPKVEESELSGINIEISVLSLLKRVNSADEIILGKDGVIAKQGFRQGVFLPQVAEETGWTKEEFLSHLCSEKAGLPPDAWKDKNTELYSFTASVFSEDDFNKK